MGTAKATKAADKSQVCRKLVTALQKLYGKSVPKIELSVVETMLFAACLEDNSWEQAEACLKKLISSYFDLNEIRVSTVSELEQTLNPLKDADWKGLRIRSILRYVFESTYSYDYEKLRRQTLEQAVKTLKKVNDITPFIRDFILHEVLGSHIICMDQSMLTAAEWLGLVPVKSDLHDASEFLKGGIKKSEVSEFCHLLRSLATDPKFVPRFSDPPDSDLSMDDVMDRFAELQLPPKKKIVKAVAVPEPVKQEKGSSVKKPATIAAPEKPPAAKNAIPPRTAVQGKPGAPAAKSEIVDSKSNTGKSIAKTTPTKTTAKATGKSVSGSTSKSSSAKPATSKAASSKPAASKKSTAVPTKATAKKPRK